MRVDELIDFLETYEKHLQVYTQTEHGVWPVESVRIGRWGNGLLFVQLIPEGN